MTDSELIKLFGARDERAISETKLRYGAYCFTVAMNILRNSEDADECISDALLAAWERIPPDAPENMQTYLGKLTRNAALSIWRRQHAGKRGAGHIGLMLEELSDAAASEDALDRIEDVMTFKETFNRFLGSLKKEQRIIFLRRYFYMQDVEEIASALGLTESKVKVVLHRTRKKLRKILESEGSL